VIVRIFGDVLNFIYSIILVWSPDEPKRVFFDMISALFIFIQLLLIPLVIAFEIELEGSAKVKINMHK